MALWTVLVSNESVQCCFRDATLPELGRMRKGLSSHQKMDSPTTIVSSPLNTGILVADALFSSRIRNVSIFSVVGEFSDSCVKYL